MALESGSGRDAIQSDASGDAGDVMLCAEHTCTSCEAGLRALLQYSLTNFTQVVKLDIRSRYALNTASDSH